MKACIAPFVFAALGLAAAPSHAGFINDACLVGTGKGQARLCGCIQQVADQTLNATDQRRAATFFTDPHQSQVERQRSDGQVIDFWDRYKDFAERAGKVCG